MYFASRAKARDVVSSPLLLEVYTVRIFKTSDFRIGMRKLKSILAICIGFVIWQIIRIPFPDLEVHPIFVYIYGMLEIRETSEKTKTMGILRLKATAVGLLVGLPLLAVFAYFEGSMQPEWLEIGFHLLLILVGTLITLTLGKIVGCGALTGVAAMVFIIMMVSHADNEWYFYAVLRALQTIIGIAVAWLLNVKLFPYTSDQQ